MAFPLPQSSVAGQRFARWALALNGAHGRSLLEVIPFQIYSLSWQDGQELASPKPSTVHVVLFQQALKRVFTSPRATSRRLMLLSRPYMIISHRPKLNEWDLLPKNWPLGSKETITITPRSWLSVNCRIWCAITTPPCWVRYIVSTTASR